VVLVHRDGAEAALPEMSGFLLPRMDDAGIGAVHLCERAPQAVRVGRRQDQMHMVWHKAPRPGADIDSAAMLDQQGLVERVVLGREKHFGPPVAALCHVVRQIGDDDAGEASHVVNLRAAIARRTG